MKSLLLALAAAVVGIAAGLACSLWRFGLPGSGDPFDVSVVSNVAIEGAPLPAPDGTRPKLLAMIKDKDSSDVVDAVDPRTAELTLDFGVMAQHASSRADFIFKNVGDGVLELKKGQSTCQCALSELTGATSSEPDHTQVKPGEQTVVRLNWKTDGPEGPFRHRADILTNDPSRPAVRLVLNGTLARGLLAEPQALTLGRIGTREEARAAFTLVAFQSDDLQIQQCSLIPPSDAEDGGSDPLAKLAEFSYQKLAPQELKSLDFGPKCGYRVTLSLKPGLPLGRIDRKIRLTTNLSEPVEMPVTGSVVGDVSVAEVGDWFPQYQFFHLGETQTDKGVSKSLYLIVGGKNAQNVQVKVKQTIPVELQAKIGTPRPSGDTLRWPITISIPPGTRAMSHADKGEYGQVILETTHPEQKEFVIDVSFLVNKPRP